MDGYESIKKKLSEDLSLRVLSDENVVIDENQQISEIDNSYKAILKVKTQTGSLVEFHTIAIKKLFSEIENVNTYLFEIKFKLFAYGVYIKTDHMYLIKEYWVDLKIRLLELNVRLLERDDFKAEFKTENLLMKPGSSLNNVYKGELLSEDKSTSIPVAIKVISKKFVDENLAGIVGEINTHLRYDYIQRIPKFHAAYLCDKDNICLFLDLIPNAVYITEAPGDLKQKAEYFIQLMTIISELHSHRLVHRDLKPSNILVTQDKAVFLIDFGVSKSCTKSVTGTDDLKGTNFYLAPESLHEPEDNDDSLTESPKKKYICRKSFDIWSIGCILSEAFSGIKPWSNFDHKNFKFHSTIKGHIKKMEKIKEKVKFKVTPANIIEFLGASVEFPIPEEIKDNHIREILSRCFEIDPQKRVKADELLTLIKDYHDKL